MHRESSPIYATKQDLRFKSHKVSSITTMECNQKSIAERKQDNPQICGNKTTQSLITNGSRKKLQGNLENIWRQMKMKQNILKLMSCSKNSAKREIYSNKNIKKEDFHINNLIICLKKLEAEEKLNQNQHRR